MKLRPELPPLIPRIAALRVSDRGYPVPFFVQWIHGQPDFRIMDPAAMSACVDDDLCWICGQRLGRFKAFVSGPMCGVNRTSAEPPSHKDCGEWAVQACPFLARPNMVRREDELSRKSMANVAGTAITRNPGAVMVWTTTSFTIFDDGNGKPLFKMADPVSVSWWKEMRPATRAEVLESVNTGLPFLIDMCEGRPEDLAALVELRADFEKYLPA